MEGLFFGLGAWGLRWGFPVYPWPTPVRWQGADSHGLAFGRPKMSSVFHAL